MLKDLLRGLSSIAFTSAACELTPRNGPRHDKTNKVTVRPAKSQISLGICPVWSKSAVRMKKPWVLSYPLRAQRRLWSDWADAQADLSLRWAHTYFVGFVMSWLKLCVLYIRILYDFQRIPFSEPVYMKVLNNFIAPFIPCCPSISLV